MQRQQGSAENREEDPTIEECQEVVYVVHFFAAGIDDHIIAADDCFAR